VALAVGLARAGSLWGVAVTASLGVALGALAAINSWDYPSYLLLTLALLGVAAWSRRGTWAARLGLWCALAAGVAALSFLAFYPFHQNYQTFDAGLTPSLWRTPLDRYLGIHGLFLFIAVTFLAFRYRSALAQLPIFLRRGAGKSPQPPFGKGGLRADFFRMRWSTVRMGVAVLAVGFFILAGYWTAAVLLGLLLLTAGAARSFFEGLAGPEPGPAQQFRVVPLVLLGLALSIGIGLDLVRLQGDIGRMNSLFKYYLEAWVLMGLAAATLLAHLRFDGFVRRSWVSGLWLGALALLLGGSFIYPVLGAPARLADRFAPLPLTLDGTAYMEQAVHGEEGQPLALKWDLEAIRWLQDNVTGSPVVLEAHHEQYHWSGRISSYTGLPTVLGWPWHQIQQRGPKADVPTRAAVVREIYNTIDATRAESLLRQYQVRYIVVGELERAYYSPQGLQKFDIMASRGVISIVFRSPAVLIYQTAW
jgi:YYY domain-containing protein